MMGDDTAFASICEVFYKHTFAKLHPRETHV